MPTHTGEVDSAASVAPVSAPRKESNAVRCYKPSQGQRRDLVDVAGTALVLRWLAASVAGPSVESVAEALAALDPSSPGTLLQLAVSVAVQRCTFGAARWPCKERVEDARRHRVTPTSSKSCEKVLPAASLTFGRGT